MTPHMTELAAAEPLSAFGSEFRVLLPADNSGGALGIFEERNGPGGGPPLHVHHDADETFLVEEGRYRFRCGEDDLEAGPGAVVFIPRGEPHTFLNIGDGQGRFRCVMTPGGFEGFFPAVAGRRLTLPEDMEAIVALGHEFKVEFVGPNPFAPEA